MRLMDIRIDAARKLHKRIKFQGLNISVENRAGSVRSGVDPGGKKWQSKMFNDYGYVKGSKGFDGEGVDCFIGPNPNARTAYVVHIMRPPDFKKYDEDKVMLGFNSAAAAKHALLRHYDSHKFFGSMDAIPMTDFRKKVLDTMRTGPVKIEAWGEPNVYDGGYQHIDPEVSYHPPSLRKPKRVPTDDPMETDNQYRDVTKRREKETVAFRNRLTKKHTDQNMRPLNTQLVSGFPQGTIGGFG